MAGRGDARPPPVKERERELSATEECRANKGLLKLTFSYVFCGEREEGLGIYAFGGTPYAINNVCVLFSVSYTTGDKFIGYIIASQNSTSHRGESSVTRFHLLIKKKEAPN